MGNVYQELKRRNVFKVGATYVIASWLIVQVADTVLPTFGTPDWVGQTLTLVLILLFPIVLIIAWAFEITPEGVRKATPPDFDNNMANVSGDKFSPLIIALLCFAVLFLLVDDYFDDIELRNANTRLPVDSQAGTNPNPDVISSFPDYVATENSIAVLMCDNLSPDPDNAYFAASLHEEVLNRLVKLRELNVVSRTSVLPYTVDNRPSPIEIARDLRVQSVLECSVAYADGRVAISAQLIDGNTGLHIWSERYNREFQDVFGIQSDIAVNIANALEAEFSISEQQEIQRRPTSNAQAYALYLRALNADRFESIELLDRVLELDPQFAQAQALKARQYAYAGRYIDNPDPDELSNWAVSAEQAALAALSLDSSIGSAHVALGILQESRLDFSAAQRSFEMAYELSPADPIVLEWNSRFFRNQGDFSRAIEFGNMAVQADPEDWWQKHLLGVTYRFAGNYDSAVALSQEAVRTDPTAPNPHVGLALAYARMGITQNAIEELHIAEALDAENSIFRLVQMAFTYALIGLESEAQELFEQFREIAAKDPQPLSLWAMAYVAIRDYELAFSYIEAAVEEKSPSDINMLFELKLNGWGDAVLQSEPQFINLRESIFAD